MSIKKPKPRGRPKQFESEDIFMKKFNTYLKKCIQKERMPNVAGFCGFCRMSRETYYKQAVYYSDTYKVIENILEDEVINTKAVGDTMKKFYLINKFDYLENSSLSISNAGNPFEIKSTDLSGLSDDQLKLLKGVNRAVGEVTG